MPMKVTVCFDRVRVIVPCGNGDIPVSELVNKAILRYRKAIGKSSDHWVTVHNLKCSDGGILDPDDSLVDVVDDREQLTADYEEQGGHVYQPHNGDGASASSAGTASPDIFQSSELHNVPYTNNKDLHGYLPDGSHDIVVTSKDLTSSSGLGLTVRHGSEPMLNVLEDENQNQKPNKSQPLIKEREETKPVGIIHAKQASYDEGKSKNALSRFARDSWRQSLGNRPDMYKWLEAQERQQDKHVYPQMERREPVGEVNNDEKKEIPPAKSPVPSPRKPTGTIPLILPNDGGPLGIHVVPEYGDDGKELGLLVQGVEPGGRVHKDGRLHVNDRIVEINGTILLGVSFPKAQEIFRASMKASEIKLQVLKRKPPPLPKNPPPVLPKPRSHTPVKPSPLTLPSPKLGPAPLSPLTPDQTSTPVSARSNSTPDFNSPGEPATTPESPSKKIPPAPPTRSPSTGLTGKTESGTKAVIALTNTKKIGKKIPIELTKGPQGLGFSVTSRDNQAGGDSPIYIKNILPKGAAVIDGRLKAGDRLLEINGIDMTGQTQSEVVSELRNFKLGTVVKLLVSRQEFVDERFTVPRELNLDDQQKQNVLQPAEKSGDEDGTLAIMRNKEILTYDIPLNDSGSAGLGVSVKGKTQTTEQGQKDLGIFVKAVIHGGAASKDGRLTVNDQLIEVNKDRLTGLSNTDAMETLRKAMQKDGDGSGYIQVVIARRIGAPSPSPYQEKCLDHFLYKNKSDEQSPPAVPWNENGIDAGKDKGDHSKQNIVNNNTKHYDNEKARKFLIDRLTSGGNGLRNESYTKATHESFNDSANMFFPGMSPAHPNVIPNHVMIEDDSQHAQNQRVRPHSTMGVFGRSSPSHSNSSSSEDLNEQPPWLKGPDWNRHTSTTSEELSPLDPPDPFSRDAAGRQSMSEKRRAHLDPRSSEYYQRAKILRDSQKAPRGVPITNLKRCSSLENLATTGVADSQNDSQETGEDPDKSTSQEDDSPASHQMSRGRGCNESFRAAVDRSYDITSESTMDTRKVEEESSESGSFGTSHGLPQSARSSVSSASEAANEDPNRKGGRRKGRDRKSGGIFKGIFKLGKSRKSEDAKNEKDKEEEEAEKAFLERGGMSRSSQEQERRLQEGHFDPDPLRQPTKDQSRQQFPPYPFNQPRVPDLHQYHPINIHSHQGNIAATLEENRHTKGQADSSNMSRAEWIQHLRSEHQRKHRERQGQYPMDDREENYEREIQQEEWKRYGRPVMTEQDYRQNSRSNSRQQQYEFEPPPTAHSYGDYAMQSCPPDIQRDIDPRGYHGQINEIIQPHSARNNIDYHHHTRQSSDSYAEQNHDMYVRRPQSRSQTPIENWRGDQLSYQAKPSYHHRQEVQASSGYYGDVFSYREPSYPLVPGQRPVHTITQPGSAKV